MITIGLVGYILMTQGCADYPDSRLQTIQDLSYLKQRVGYLPQTQRVGLTKLPDLDRWLTEISKVSKASEKLKLRAIRSRKWKYRLSISSLSRPQDFMIQVIGGSDGIIGISKGSIIYSKE
jgi:hypothetical protein